MVNYTNVLADGKTTPTLTFKNLPAKTDKSKL